MLEKARRVGGALTSLCDGGNQVLVVKTGTFEGIQEISQSLGIATFNKQRRIIPPNPSAGEVRSREVRYGPWMEATNRRIEAENTKARRVLFEKRVFELAKQATYSLEGVGIRCEMTMIANILRTACKHRALLGNEQQHANPPTKKRDEVEHACRVLDACLQFDARRLAILLGFNIKVHKTFGEGVAL